jgi:hypothetical protein
VRISKSVLTWSLVAPVVLSATAAFLFGIRASWAAPTWFMYLPYTLVLAWIPLVVSTLAVVIHRRWVVVGPCDTPQRASGRRR